MKKRMLNILCWGCSVFLIAIYVYILYLGFFPNVCREYKMYYIDETLVDWPGYGGLKYKLGEKMYFGSDYSDVIKNCGAGWGAVEAGARWTDGNEAKLYFDVSGIIEENYEVPLVFSLEIVNTLADKVEVLCNGILLGTIRMDDKNFVTVLSEDLIKKGFLEFTFAIDNPVRPCDVSDSLDDRQLGIMVKSVEIKKIQSVAEKISFASKKNMQEGISAEELDKWGWSHAEELATWTDGNIARLLFYLEDEKKFIKISTKNIVAEGKIEVICNGKKVGDMSKELGREYIFYFDNPIQGLVSLDFLISNPVRPCDDSDSPDKRWLGLYASEISFGE